MPVDQSKTFGNVRLSILDLAPIVEGSTAREAFQNSVDLAQHAEKWGYNRYWLAEHHNMPGIGSSATSLLIGHIAGATETIRVGSGGIMLPNHATLVIAEQFGTLESLYPERIDLGLGRAPGTDQATAFALRRTLNTSPEDFPMQVEELRDYFSKEPVSRVRSVPGTGLDIPMWLLGSSGFSAQLAAEKGFPFSFASHFAPDNTLGALNLYRQHFKASQRLHAPYSMIGVNIVAADTNEHAEYLATSLKQQFLNMQRGHNAQLQPPVEDMDSIWNPLEKSAVEQTLDPRYTIIGDKETVKQKLETILQETQADEVIINSQIYNHEDRKKSYEIVGSLLD